MSDKRATLTQAIADHVHAGDVLHPVVGHTRWTAATREVVRQWWGRDPDFTLVMLSLSSLGALFFRGELVRKVVTEGLLQKPLSRGSIGCPLAIIKEFPRISSPLNLILNALICCESGNLLPVRIF